MSVWFCIPSKRPADDVNRVVAEWRAMGYKVALWRDAGDDLVDCDYLQIGTYPGYAKAVNSLSIDVLRMDQKCDWVVTGGDDTSPDKAKQADVIARECSRHFGKCDILDHGDAENVFGTYGVMQPTGDRWGENRNGVAPIDRIAGSPWMGREWCIRAHHGLGPLHPDFFHMFVDEALRGAAVAQGVYWERRDIVQTHWHWSRERRGSGMPSFLRTVNSQPHWNEARAIFNRIQRGGYQECLPA
jgi:hypothetical protein